MTDDLTTHPTNVHGREAIDARLDREIAAFARDRLTGTVSVEVAFNAGIIQTVKTAVADHERISRPPQLTPAAARR